MCGACGDRTAADWTRPWFAGLPARTAAAHAALRLAARPGLRVSACPGGWLVTAPTGRTTACGGLDALVAAVRPWGPAVPELLPGPPVRLPAPPPDGRRGVVLRVRPDARPVGLAEGLREVTVPDENAALAVLARLATVPWSLHCYLRAVAGVEAAWGLPAETVTGAAPDVLAWLEWVRQAGELDGRAIAARCPLEGGHTLDVEVRAGHVVRALVSVKPS
ncbi:hypothetical protein [Qaidamihabitans albus]|uniref:hypothetical protein n=1 Tax=Qaidamihabitans albus TaxID=2795733 RepID=UPI0018F26A2E|nr:hypothetical protein [Qaidamihabitans albus]